MLGYSGFQPVAVPQPLGCGRVCVWVCVWGGDGTVLHNKDLSLPKFQQSSTSPLRFSWGKIPIINISASRKAKVESYDL